MAFADLMKRGVVETPEEEQIRLQQEEARKINLFEGWDNTVSDDLLFSPPSEAEAPTDYARNTLQAYYSKELGVDSLPEEAFNQFIKEDFGETADYDTALASLQETKRWGTEARDPTKLELAKYEKLTAGDWLRSFSANTSKAVYGIDAGLMRAAAATAAAVGKEDSIFYETMMGAADDMVARGQAKADIMTGDKFFKDITSDEANNDIFAQNLGQLMVVIPLGVATGGTSWGVSLATVGAVNSGMLFNEGFQQARDDGQNDKEALKTAGLYTLAAAPSETLIDLATAGVFKPFVKYASKLSGPVRQRIVRTAIQGLTAAGPGGFVEGGQYALLNKLTDRKIDQGEFWATVRAGAILEGLGGSMTQVAGEIDSARATAKLRKDFRPVFGNQTDAVVGRIMGDGDPNNALNREVLNLISADFEAISLLGEKSELKARAEKASDDTFNELWKQAESEERAKLDEEIKKRAELEAHEAPEDIILEEEAPATGTPETPVQPARAEKQKAQARKEQLKIRAENKKRKAALMEAMTADTAEKRTVLLDNGTEVYEDGTPVEADQARPIPVQATEQEVTPPPVNRLDPNNGENLARLTLAVMENEGLSQEQAVQRVASLTGQKRKQYLEILDDGTMETVDLTPEEIRIQAIDDRLEEIGRAPQPPQTKTAFPEGLNSGRIKSLQQTMTREQAEQMYADGDQKNDFIAAVFDGDRKAVQRFNARSLGREVQQEFVFEPTTSYEEAVQASSVPEPVAGEVVAVGEKTPAKALETFGSKAEAQGYVDRLLETVQQSSAMRAETEAAGLSPASLYLIKKQGSKWGVFISEEQAKATQARIASISEDGTLATVNGKPVLTSKLKRSKQAVSEKVSKQVAEKTPPAANEQIKKGSKRIKKQVQGEFQVQDGMTVAESLEARNAEATEKVVAKAVETGIPEEQALFENKQAEVGDLNSEGEEAPVTVGDSIEEIGEVVDTISKNEQSPVRQTPAASDTSVIAGVFTSLENAKYGDFYEVKFADGTRIAVRENMDNPRGGGDPVFKTIEEATAHRNERAIRLKANADSRARAEATEKAAAEVEAKKNDLQGFTEGMDNMRAANVKKALFRNIRNSDGTIMRRKERIERDVKNGMEIRVEDGETRLYMKDGRVPKADGTFQENVEYFRTPTKAEIDYAKYLIGLRDGSPQGTPPTAPDTLYQKSTEQRLREHGLTAEQAKQLLATKTETQTIDDIQKSFNTTRQEAAGVVAVIQSLGLDVNNFVFTKDGRVTTKFVGKTQFIPQLGKALVTAGTAADLETAIHETAHVARRLLLSRGGEGAVDESIISAVEAEYGVNKVWSRKQEELLAEDFVDYIRSGAAPSANTETLFQKMANWIKNVTRYFSVQNRTVPENMQKLFGELMKNGEISETINQELEVQVKQAQEAYQQAQTAYDEDTPVGFGKPPKAYPERGDVFMTKRHAEKIIGKHFAGQEKSVLDTVERARVAGLLGKGRQIADQILSDLSRPPNDIELIAISFDAAVLSDKRADLMGELPLIEQRVKDSAGTPSQRGHNANYTRTKNMIQQIEADLEIMSEAQSRAGTEQAAAFNIRQYGFNTGTLDPVKVIRDMEAGSGKPITEGDKFKVTSAIKNINTLQDAIRSANISVAVSAAEQSILYMKQNKAPALSYEDARNLVRRIEQGLSSEGMTPETAMSLRALAQDLVANGQDDVYAITDSLVAQFGDMGLEKTDVWYAISGRFVDAKKAKTDLQMLQQKLKKEAELLSKLKDAEQGVLDFPTTPDTLSDPAQAKRHQELISNLSHQYRVLRSFYEQNTPNPQQRKRYMDAIEKAQLQLEGNFRDTRPIQKKLDEETKALKDKMADIRGQVRDTDAKALIDEAIRVWATPIATKTQSEQSNARLATKKALKDARDTIRRFQESPSTDEVKQIANLLEQISKVEDEIDNQYRNLPKYKKVEPSQAVKELRADLQDVMSERNLADRIVSVRDQIKNFDENTYLKTLEELKKNPEFKVESKKTEQYRRELANERATLRTLQERAKTSTARRRVKAVWDLAKGTLLAGDSGLGRQAAFLLTSGRANILDLTAKSMQAYGSGMFKGTKADALELQLAEKEIFPIAVRHGIKVPGSQESFTEGEMIVGNTIADNIPIIGNFIKGSNRGQSITTTLARLATFESFYNKYKNREVAGVSFDEELDVWAEWTNISTGRSVGTKVDAASKWTDYALLSTRYMVSRFQAMGMPAYYSYKSLKGNKAYARVSKEAWKDLIFFFASRVAMFKMFQLAMGKDDRGKNRVDMEFDPIKNTFMKLQVHLDGGNTRVYDPFAGIAQPLRLVLSTPTKMVQNQFMGGDYAISPVKEATHYLTGRLTPSLSAAESMASGKDYFGVETPRWKLLGKAYAPLPLQELYETVRESDDPMDIFASTLLNITSFNSYFIPTKKLPK